jgi:hypothetical protein
MKITKGNVTPRGKARYRDANEEKVANNLISAAGHFVSAVNSTVMFAKAQTKVPEVRPDRVVVMGGGALLRGLPEYLESNLNLPVELFDPIDSIDLSALSAEQQDALRKEAGSIGVTLGLAQMAADPAALRVEVLPPAERKRRKLMQETVPVVISAGVLAVALIVSFVASGAAADEGRKEKQELESIQERYRQNQQEFEKASEEVKLLNEEKFRVRRLVSMGPAVQDVLDALQGTLVDFDEIFVEKVVASVKTVQRKDEAGTAFQDEVPSVEFVASIQPLGNRAVAVAYSDFVTAFNRLLTTARPHLVFQEMGGFDAKSGTFKFRVEQNGFPEKANQDK